MTDDPFILPDEAHTLTPAERGLVLAVIAQLIAKREDDEKAKAPVFSLHKYREQRE
nr:hypothetical protein [Rhodococcus sp. 15-649-1-2]